MYIYLNKNIEIFLYLKFANMNISKFQVKCGSHYIFIE